MTLPDAFSSEPIRHTVPLPPAQRSDTKVHGVDPLQLFEHLYGDDSYGFLYESLEAHGGRGRFSFLGGRPALIFKSKADRIEIQTNGGSRTLTAHPLDELRVLVATRRRPPHDAACAPFSGGAVGYLSYDVVGSFEKLPATNPDPLAHPDAYFLFPDEIVVLDHRDRLAHIILYNPDATRLSQIEFALAGGTRPTAPPPVDDLSATPPVPDMSSNMTRAQFARAVERARQYIRAGDVFQVVLAQRFSFDVSSAPVDLYRALRITNPSPYMYYLNLDGLNVLGSSPEVLVKLEDRTVTSKPLAGTRPRGRTPEEDQALARELQADPKERAEHVMLVDLARNDIGRVCEFGSIRVTEALGIERYSKVMHLVSNVEGRLRSDCDAFDLVTASFPAGTVSGAPKIRAMQIIDELEPEARGIYAGAIGYFGSTSQMDLCIAIRTIVVNGQTGYIQAGAGIVADSDPEREYTETLNKAAGLFRAVELARRSHTPPAAGA